MECIFPRECNCPDCRFERLEAIFEATSAWHTGERTNIEMFVPYVAEDHDPVQPLPTDEDEDILPF
jgi:hypothetical protein